MSAAPTPGQTVGPFFHVGLPFPNGPHLVGADHPGRLVLHGRVLDGQGHAVPDALVELWQRDPEGRVPDRGGSLGRGPDRVGTPFTGWGRAATDADGGYSFTTLAPGAGPHGEAPYFALCVFARGLLDRLMTRAYLPADPERLASDRVLAALPPERRRTLLCRPTAQGVGFDIRLQGEDETLFLDFRPSGGGRR